MIKTKLTISRPIGGDGEKNISIAIQDADAWVEFVRLLIPLDKFAEALTGLAYVECEAEVADLDKVGKKRERRSVRVRLPDDCGYDEREDVAYKLAKEKYGDKWEVSKYFGSQNSFTYDAGNTYANVELRRWL